MQNEGGEMSGLHLFAAAASASNDRLRLQAKSARVIQLAFRRVLVTRPKRAETALATYGDGVDVRESTLQGAGRGLFATRSFQAKQRVCEYTGTSLCDKVEAAKCSVQTHVVHCSPTKGRGSKALGNDIYIAGDRTPQMGRGCASFANHRPHAECNARFVGEWIDGVGRVFLHATRPISANEEIFVHCGNKEAWRIMMGIARMVLDTNIDGKVTIRTVDVEDP